MSQISVHNESQMATVHSSHVNGGSEAIKHLAAVLRLLRLQDQLKMVRGFWDQWRRMALNLEGVPRPAGGGLQFPTALVDFTSIFWVDNLFTKYMCPLKIGTESLMICYKKLVCVLCTPSK